MTKVSFDIFTEEKAPPIDWLKAAILERQNVLCYNLKDLAAVGGITYDYMRRLIHTSPWLWPKKVRENVCNLLGITIDMRKAIS